MKTFAALLGCWVAALGVWVGFIELTSREVWGDARGFALTALWLGAPLIIVAPLIMLPTLKLLNRRVRNQRVARIAMVAAGGLLALPPALWPLLLVGGNVRDLLSSAGNNLIVLYLAFGLFVGTWYAAFRRPVIL